MSSTFALGLRFEAFYDDSTVFEQPDVDNTSITLTGSYTNGNFTFKPELRLDQASASIFTGANFFCPKNNWPHLLLLPFIAFNSKSFLFF